MHIQAAICVRGLRKNYGEFEAVKGIDFEVGAGEVFGLLGPNGAGKTTTVEILEGLRPRTAGEVSVLGFDPAVLYVPHPIQNRTADELNAIADAAAEKALRMLVAPA